MVCLPKGTNETNMGLTWSDEVTSGLHQRGKKKGSRKEEEEEEENEFINNLSLQLIKERIGPLSRPLVSLHSDKLEPAPSF